MGTAVLRSQGVLDHRARSTSLLHDRSKQSHHQSLNSKLRSRRRSRPNERSNPAPSFNSPQPWLTQKSGRPVTQSVGERRRSTSVPLPESSKTLAMGKGTILKKEEQIRPVTGRTGTTFSPEIHGLKVFSMEPVQKRADLMDEGAHALGVFVQSPPPSSVPLPGFVAKDKDEDAATSDLWRLLRLDMAI